MKISEAHCEVCGKTLEQDPLYRVNVGEVPSRWRCWGDLDEGQRATVTDEERDIIAII